MRYTSKTFLGLASALFIAMSATAYGQASDTIQVRVEVSVPITVTGVADLDFGEVLAGTVTAITVDPSTSPDAGLFNVDAIGGQSVALTFAPPANLGAGLTFGAWEYRAGTTQGAATAVLSGGTLVAPTATNGDFSVWIGGTLNVAATAPVGVHTGIFTLTVATN